MHALLGLFVQPVSRRLVNAAYVCWQLWFHLLILLAFQLLQLLHRSLVPLCSVIDSKLSHHALLFFILSNLGTGAVNLSIWTWGVNDSTALGVVLLYIHLLVIAVHAYAVGQECNKLNISWRSLKTQSWVIASRWRRCMTIGTPQVVNKVAVGPAKL
jgi:hypothetical protein